MAVAPRSRPETPANGGGTGWLVAAAGVMVAACAVVVVMSCRDEAHDPGYLRARDSVTAYETGKELVERNFDDPVYREALEALDRVPATSISAEPAAQLAREIRMRTAEFHARVKAEQDRLAMEERLRREREEAMFLAQRQQALNPQTEFPECEEEEGGHKHAH